MTARPPNPARRRFLPILCAAALVSVPAAPADTAAEATGDQVPNILLVLADDLGSGDVRALNPGSKLPTPHLDALAGSGMVFTDGHSPSAVCTPTRYGLLTGRYCWRSRLKRGVLGGYSPPLIEDSRPTIASVLSSAGYRTALVGKWHLGMELPMLSAGGDTAEWNGDPGVNYNGRIGRGPLSAGFGSFFGVTASLDMPPYVFVRDGRFESVPTVQQPAVKFPAFVRTGPRAEGFEFDTALDQMVDEARAVIAGAAADSEPFFLYFPLTAPHKPAIPHGRFRGTTGLGDYGDFVTQVDAAVGAVLAQLDESGVADHTVVVFSSDNGSYMYRYDPSTKPADHTTDATQQGYYPENHRSNAQLRGTKADIWEAGHRIPFFVRWPGVTGAGSRCDETVCLVDLFATCAEIAGATAPAGSGEDSVSLVPMLRGDADATRGVPVIHHSGAGMFAIRDGRWKLIAGNGSGGREKPTGKPFEPPFQLYDLAADPGESHDLAAEQPEIVERLTAKLAEIRGAD